MSFGKAWKLAPKKPKPESEQNLDVSTEFLVWDTQFNLNNLSDKPPATLSQDASINDTASSQLPGTPET